MLDLSDKLTVFLITSGEPSTAQCRRLLEAQDCEFRLTVVTGITPMDRAFQMMLDHCETPYFVQVDADMLLSEGAISTLWSMKQQHEEPICCGWLWGDAEEMPILGVKIYDHAIMKAYPFSSDSGSCEMTQIRDMRADGHEVYTAPKPHRQGACLGEHFSLQTREMAYRRWKRLTQKMRAYPWLNWVAPYPKRLLKKASEGSELHLAAALGALAGLSGDELPDGELDASCRDQAAQRVLSSVSEGPEELVVYVTDHCNHACPFCLRTKTEHGEQKHIAPALVQRVLTQWPTIKGICLAGFGEPLLHPEIGRIIGESLDRDKAVGLITNGALLAHRLHELPEGLSYLSVSLNAADQLEHEAASGVKTWDRVLLGIGAAKDAGYNVGASFVLTVENLERAQEYLQLASDLGVRFVNLLNLLPHGGADEWFQSNVLRSTPEVRGALEKLKQCPGAEKVIVWPRLLPSSSPPRACLSPFKMIGVDPRAGVTGCRRVVPPSLKTGNVIWGAGAWHSAKLTDLRLAMTGDRPLPEPCKTCWACWGDY